MQIFIRRNNDQRGPFDLFTIQQGLDSGKILSTDSAWYEGAPGWLLVSQLPGIRVNAPVMPPPHPDDYKTRRLGDAPTVLLGTTASASPPPYYSPAPLQPVPAVAPPPAQNVDTSAAGDYKGLKTCGNWLLQAVVYVVIFLLLWNYVPAYRGLFNRGSQKTAYSGWELQDTVTKQPAKRDLEGIEVSELRNIDENTFLPKMACTVTNKSKLELGSVQVFILFKNANGVSMGEVSDTTGALKPNEEWEVSVYIPRGADTGIVSHTIAFAPLEYARN